MNVESQTEHKFSDHSGLHSESKPSPEPEVKVRDETKEKEGRARATEIINCQTESVENLLPTVLQLLSVGLVYMQCKSPLLLTG